MARTVRVPVRALKEVKLESHYDSYQRAFKNDGTFVPGEGDVMSPVVFIGEAPGAEEERLGKPFIGPSGNLLTKAIRSIGPGREEVFITNLVKYRPPQNADPTPEQAAAARVMMEWELAILKPRVVVTLGKFATEVFYPTPSMRTLSGTSRVKMLSQVKYRVVPIYHPSAALRSSNVRELFFEHFQIVKEAIETKGM